MINNSTDLVIDDTIEFDGIKLTKDQYLKATAKLLGYTKMPVSIDQFIEDPYYLGKTYGNKALYPYWKDQLLELYPSPIHTSNPFIVLTGSLGTGKSTFSKICAMYLVHRLDCLQNLHYFGIAGGKNTVLVFSHRTQSLAQMDFIDSIDMIGKDSPYFTNLWDNGGSRIPINYAADGERSNVGIGSDVIFYNLSELNFINYDNAMDKISTAFGRWDSRFGKAKGYLGHIILDTSSSTDESVVEDYIRNNSYNPLIIRSNRWIIKKHLNQYYQLTTGTDKNSKDDHKDGSFFRIYTGDSVNGPFIITESKPLKLLMDPDRVLECPLESYANFKLDIVKSLQDEAGISTTSTGKYLDDPTNFLSCCVIPQAHKDVFKVSEKNRNDRIIDYIHESVKLIPTDKPIFIHADIGVTSDYFGVGISYFDKMVRFDPGSDLLLPSYVTPIAFSMDRNEGEETSIMHFEDLVLELRKSFNLGCFTYDSFGSRQLKQDLEREGIPVRYLSVDRTDAAYLYFKMLVNNGLWKGPDNSLLKYEITNLKHTNGIVDHKVGFSKDISDAVIGSIYSCYEMIDVASELLGNNKIDKQNALLMMVGGNKDTEIIENALKNLFKY